MTHFPPITSVDYDYDNANLVSSDILDWQASGGTTTKVNRDLWKNIVYPIPWLIKITAAIKRRITVKMHKLNG